MTSHIVNVRTAPATVAGSHRAELSELTERLATDPRVAELVEVIRRRADRWVQHPTLVVPGEMHDWWHVSWERLSDVAFVQRLDPEPARGAWLRSEVLRLCDLPVDEWVGPFFRERLEPVIGMLETAHVGLAVAAVLELCPEVLDDAEHEHVRGRLLMLCVEPCERALIARESGLEVVRPGVGTIQYRPGLQNWYCVLLNAFGTIALLLQDQERVSTLPERVARAEGLHNRDSYGESVQYWGYTAIHLTHLRELAEVRTPGLLVPVEARHRQMVEWLCQSLMFTDRSRDLGPGTYTTFANFGDSAFTARPPSDALTSVARFDDDARRAGLARWLFDRTYSTPELAPTDLSSFAFFNQIGWRTVVNLIHTPDSIDPATAGLAVSQEFATGLAAVRDGWAATRTVLAAHTGHHRLNVDAHRHDDAGSFVLGYRGEVFFTDPGHCCYRLHAYREAVADTAHSTWQLRGANGAALVRTRGSHAPVGTRYAPHQVAGTTVLGVELSDLYPEQVVRARRFWITAMPHVVLVADEIESEVPVTTATRFVLNNRDNLLRVNHATESRLVLRRGEAAAKFFRLVTDTEGVSFTDAPRRSWSAAHDIYHPQPNADTQGREGSAWEYTWAAPPATSFRGLYAIVLADEAEIRGWHIEHEDSVVTVRPPGGADPIVLDVPRLLATAQARS